MTTDFPDDIDVLVDPTPGDPLSASNGKASTAYITDLNDAVEGLESLLVGPTFVNPLAYGTTAETLVNDAESVSGSGPNAGTWVAVNVVAGPLSSGTNNQGSASITGTLFTAAATNPDLTSKYYLNFTTPIPVGTHPYITMDARHQGNEVDVETSTAFFISDGADKTGIVSIKRWPNDPLVNTWVPIRIPTAGLTEIKCIGIYTKGWRGTQTKFYLDNIRWEEMTELQTAMDQNGGSSVIVPGVYEPSGTQAIPLVMPSNVSKLDLRPGNEHLSRAGGVRHIREFEIPDNDATMTGLQFEIEGAINSLSPNDTLLFAPKGVYRLTDKITIQTHNITIDGQGCAFIHEGYVGAQMFDTHYVNNVTIRNCRFFGTAEETVLGSALVAFGGTPTFGVGTAILDAQHESVRRSQISPYAMDRNGEIVVEVTHSSTATVANDLAIAFYDGDAPAAATVVEQAGSQGGVPPGTMYYRYSFVDEDGNETSMSPPVALTSATYHRADLTIAVKSNPTDGPRWVARRIYRSANNAGAVTVDNEGTMRLVAEVSNNTQTLYRDNTAESNLDQTIGTAPTVVGAGLVEAGAHGYWTSYINSAGREYTNSESNHSDITLTAASQVSLALPGVGASGIVARRIYRTKADDTTTPYWRLFLVAQINDNTTATYVDNTPDASLTMTDVPSLNIATQNLGQVVMGMVTVTPTPTPTTTILRFRPHQGGGRDCNLGIRMKKTTATANTITISSIKTYTRVEYGLGGVENGHGISVTEQSAGIVIENCLFEGLNGDAVYIAGQRVRDVTVRDCVSRGCRRQGMTVVCGQDLLFERCDITETGRSGIDIEPAGFQNMTYRIVIKDCKFRSINNYAIAAHWSHQLIIQDCRLVGRNSFGTVGFLYGGGAHVKALNIHTPHWPFAMFGNDMVIDGLDTKSLAVTNSTYALTWQNVPETSGPVTVRNVTLYRAPIDGSAVLISVPNALVENISYKPLARTFTGTIVGQPFDIRTGRQAILDPGPFADQLSSTYKGIIAGDLWFPRGQDMKSEGLLTLRGLSGGTTRANNLSGTVAVTAGTLTQTVVFPTKSYAALAAFNLTGATTTGATLPLGANRYRIASRSAVGGPTLPTAEVSVTLTGTQNRVTVGAIVPIVGTTHLEGLTVYRGTAAGVYTTRYDIVPTDPADLFAIVPAANGQVQLVDSGIYIQIANVSNVGYPLTFPPQSGTWTTAAGPNQIADETGWEPDASFRIMAVPSWPTTVAVTTKRRSGFDFDFGTPCPVGGGTVDWFLVR